MQWLGQNIVYVIIHEEIKIIIWVLVKWPFWKYFLIDAKVFSYDSLNYAHCLQYYHRPTQMSCLTSKHAAVFSLFTEWCFSVNWILLIELALHMLIKP